MIPAREQSWISKGITRFDPISVTRGKLGSHDAAFVTGTPADCVSLGLYNFSESKADFVLSGINIGHNAGLAYFLSSGTVAGACEGYLARVPSIAFSLDVPEDVFRLFHNRDKEKLALLEARFKKIGATAALVAGELLDPNSQSKTWGEVDFFTVNLPWNVDTNTRRVRTVLKQTYYGQLFVPIDGKFIHKMLGIVPDTHSEVERSANSSEDDDVSVVERGEISISAIRYRNIAANV